MKLLGSLLLILFGLLLAVVVGWGTLENLFAEHPDSPAGTYLTIGLPAVILGMAMVAVGLLGMRRHS